MREKWASGVFFQLGKLTPETTTSSSCCLEERRNSWSVMWVKCLLELICTRCFHPPINSLKKAKDTSSKQVSLCKFCRFHQPFLIRYFKMCIKTRVETQLISPTTYSDEVKGQGDRQVTNSTLQMSLSLLVTWEVECSRTSLKSSV